MPHEPRELFGDVVVGPPSARSRRSSVALASGLAHMVAVLALLIVPLVATDALPHPNTVIQYFAPPDVTPIVLPPPFAPARVERLTPAPTVVEPTATPQTPESVAPLVAPTGIADETGPEGGGSRGGGTSDIAPPGFVPGAGSGVGVVTEPPAPPQAPVRLHAGITAPQKIADVRPVYPAIAQQVRVQGVVIIEATIDTQGNVIAARVLKSVPLLDQAALDAVRRWKFTPALLSGVPVPVIMTVTVNFQLQ